mmetsp:Transcript_22607/g.32292  ORF Transcript_22607/g.32292 Transcript_22607/m.32292 type:complete len:102 (-) Transcript_22607:687-992(-)
MAKTKSGGPPKPSNKRKTTSKKATKPSNNNKSAAKPDADDRVDREESCIWGDEVLVGGCIEPELRGDLKCCEGALACNNMMHVGCYLRLCVSQQIKRPWKI